MQLVPKKNYFYFLKPFQTFYRIVRCSPPNTFLLLLATGLECLGVLFLEDLFV